MYYLRVLYGRFWCTVVHWGDCLREIPYVLLLFNFPKIWNEAPDIKNNPSISVFLKNIKSAMLNMLIA
jgi:hypothetical protein